jgi:hypothetical protein
VSSKWITDYIDKADFTGLFVEELGWERPARGGRKVKVDLDGEKLELTEVASFRGVGIWSCPSVPSGQVQRSVDKALRKESAERVVIFHDENHQVWRWPQARDSAGAGTPRLVTHEHVVGRPNEALRQRLQFVQIGMDEGGITVLEVVRRLRRAFDSDKVTKSFYSKFAQQHRELTEVIKGLTVSDTETKPEARLYGSILLNRLMFIYFMQRKGFLDGDYDYLRNRLDKIATLKTPGSFYEFYKDFLIPLFHEGLGADLKSRAFKDPAIKDLIGDIPYINGGIFSKHPLEEANEISVPDAAFRKLFDFFDQWQWHLDERPSGNPKEINPDVLGYIFEQFVNNREEVSKGNKAAATNADKGAFYTKEDVTGYMTANTLVPVFLDRLLSRVHVNLWRLVTLDPERYIWSSMKHGCELPLPNQIEKEMGLWPCPAWSEIEVSSELGLPAESWWEVIDRRKHVEQLMERARIGGLDSIELCVTNNLDLETLAVDLIDTFDTPEDVISSWEVLSDLRVIDPTCGSGAFLFAALNIFHRLYTATFDAAVVHVKTAKNPELKKIVASAAAHPNRDYFLLKHISLNNLYGVDLMPEAVEIARLRLFLKLISQIDKKEDIEPLPDLEFNIRSGNVLVGAVSAEDLSSKSDIFNNDRLADLELAAVATAENFRSFSLAQQSGLGHVEVLKAKARLRELADRTRMRLDEWWFQADGSDADRDLNEYVKRHRPFHWFMEFPEVFNRGGFDVVVGNPPYVATTKIDYEYSGFTTDRCPDIYAPCLERASQITCTEGRMSMIVPMNLAWGGEFAKAREVLVKRFGTIWASTYDQMPSRLFEGVGTRNTILLAGGGTGGVHTASFNKWVSEFRPHLMATQRYVRHDEIPEPWPKVGHNELIGFATSPQGGMSSLYSDVIGSKRLGYKKTANYWISVFLVDPPCLDGNRQPMAQKEVGELHVRNEEDQCLALAVAASRAMFLWWVWTGDAFHVLGRQIKDFPLSSDKLSKVDRDSLISVGKRLAERLAAPGDHLLWTPYAGAWYGNFDLTRCRDITDEADEVILRHFGLDACREIFEVEYRNYMKSGGERPGTVRGPAPDRDR